MLHSRRGTRSQRLHALAVLVGLFASVAGVFASAGAASASSQQVVFPQGVTGHGTYATVNFSLAVPGSASLEVAGYPLPAGQTHYDTTYPDADRHIITGLSGQVFHVNVTGLNPNRVYYATIHGYDPVSGTSDVFKNVGFKTMHRNVKLDLTKLAVTNDGDGLGCGELFGFIDAGSHMMVNPSGFLDALVPYAKRCDNRSYGLNITSGTKVYNMDDLVLRGTIVDDDTVFGCSTGTNCGDWGTTGWKPINLRPLDGRTMENFTKSIAFGVGSGVKATLSGTLTVSYSY
jgi:hypothetical protein